MRISDWSSDVCSSDLKFSSVRPSVSIDRNASIRRCSEGRMASRAMMTTAGAERIHPMPAGAVPLLGVTAQHHEPRSEEHTSELQSLMRISYAVFCLKKKTK